MAERVSRRLLDHDGVRERPLDLRAAARAVPVAINDPGPLAASVAETWRGRMIHEHGSSFVFEALAAGFDELDYVDDARECRGFAAEEREHGALCGAVVEAAGGEATALVAEVPAAIAAHRDTTPRAAAARNVLSVSCLSETVAVALISAERLEMPEGPLRALLTRILSDEIGHARFGWRYLARELPQLDTHERAAVERYLPTALGALETHELAHLPAGTRWPREGAAFGLCDGDDARLLFAQTVAEVIVPQLDALGLGASRAWEARERQS